MNENEIRQAFQPYKHPYWGVVGRYVASGEGEDTYTTDNYHFFNALYERVLNSYGYKFTDKEAHDYGMFYDGCVKEKGLFARFPTRMSDDISQDEIYGACYSGMGEHIEGYGEKNWWCYWLANPNHWHWTYFFGRYPSFNAYVKACAGKPIYFSQFLWCIGFLFSALTSHDETTGKLQSWLMIPIMRKYFIPRLAIMAWCVIIRIRYKDGIKDLMKIYFGDNHAFTLCTTGISL